MYNPPIENRTTDELMEMVSNIEDRNEDARIIAHNELLKRGIKTEEQVFRKDITEKAKRKKSTIKENASYSLWYKLFLFFLPFVAIHPLFSTESVIDLENEGFYRKAKQRFFAMLFGFIMWVILLVYFII